MKLLLSVLIALSAHAQSFYAAGASALPQSSPKPSGWTAVAILASSANKLYSISGTDWTLNDKKLAQAATWTGIATPAKVMSFGTLYALGAAGGATTGQNTGAAITGGAILFVPIKAGKWGALVAGYTIVKSTIGGTQDVLKLGWGIAIK
jgi:hypothetical protein